MTAATENRHLREHYTPSQHNTHITEPRSYVLNKSNNQNHRWWDLTIFTQQHRSYKHWYSFGWKPDGGRNRPKHVVLYHPLINIVRNTCCVIDWIPLPIIYTHNGDGTFQKIILTCTALVVNGFNSVSSYLISYYKQQITLSRKQIFVQDICLSILFSPTLYLIFEEYIAAISNTSLPPKQKISLYVIWPSVPCRRFAACKRSLNLSGSRNLGKITGQFLAHSSTFRC